MISLESLASFGKVRPMESLKKHTTYKIGGVADFFIQPAGLEELCGLISFLTAQAVPWLVLGLGSNVLIDDQPFHGVVICLKKAFASFSFVDNKLIAQAGCSMILLAHEARKRSLSGLEFASGIPGTVGGGLYMNAGAYRSDMASILESVRVLTPEGIRIFGVDELEFTYRHSRFQHHKDWIILEAVFRLEPGEESKIAQLMDSRRQRRLQTQPLGSACAGSVFRNPPGMAAWKIIDDLGYRGAVIGGARVSEMHANFIVNADGQASARDVDQLIRLIQKEARRQFGVELITEVERINWHGEEETEID